MNINLDICRQFNCMFHIVECKSRIIKCGHKLLDVTLECENSFLHNNVWLPLAVFFFGGGGGSFISLGPFSIN